MATDTPPIFRDSAPGVKPARLRISDYGMRNLKAFPFLKSAFRNPHSEISVFHR
jgi:hypothetical protein